VYVRIVIVEIRLMRIKTMPVVCLGKRVPSPVGRFKILEDNPGFLIPMRRVTPNVKVPPSAPGLGPSGPLEPSMLVGSVVHYQFRDDAQLPSVGFSQEGLEVPEASIRGVNAGVVGNIITVIFQRRGTKGKEPDHSDPQLLKIIELSCEPFEVTQAVTVMVGEGLDVELVNDGVFVPEGPVFQPELLRGLLSHG
jgi:hypothetical protein